MIGALPAPAQAPDAIPGRSFALEDFKRDPRNRMLAVQAEFAAATDSFRYFVQTTMGFDGTRGLSERQRLAGMRAIGADGVDFTDPAYDPVWPFFEQAKTRSSLLMLPRFTGKSTLIALWCLWMGLKNPNTRLGLIGWDFEAAASILSMVRRWMSADVKGDLRKVFGVLGRLPPLGKAGEKAWGREDYLDFPGKTAVSRDHTITAIGMGEASEGGHFEIVILEDLVNRVSSQTRDGVESVKRFVRLASGLGMTIQDERGNVIGTAPKMMVGTPWDLDDAYMEALRSVEEAQKNGEEPNWNVVRLQARVPREGTRFVEGPGGTQIAAHFTEYDQDCKPRFRHLTDAVLKHYRYSPTEMGAVAYASQMDLDPIPLENRTLKAHWFTDHYYQDSDIWEMESVQGIDGRMVQRKKSLKATLATAGYSDLSGTTGESRDRTSHGAWAMDTRGHLYLLEEVVGRFAPDDEDEHAFTPNSNLGFMAKWTKKYHFTFVGVEAGVLRTVYEALAAKWNRTHPDDRIRLVKVASGGARGNLTNDRAMAIAQMAEAGMVHIKPEHADYLQEILKYTPAKDNSRDDRVAMTALACINNHPWPFDRKPEAEEKLPVRSVQRHINELTASWKKGKSSEVAYCADVR